MAEERKTWAFRALLLLSIVLAGLLANPNVTDRMRSAAAGEGITAPSNTQVRDPGDVRVETVDLTASEGVRGMIGHRALHQQPHTSGPSPDTLRMVFDAPALVHGVLISVDVGGFPLVEVSAGVNVSEPYGMLPDDDLNSQAFQAEANWLIHTSSTGGSDIDEHVMFPKPIRVDAGDYVALWGWVRNGGGAERAVHPEMIVYYETVQG